MFSSQGQFSPYLNMPPKKRAVPTSLGVKETVECHLCKKKMRFDFLRDEHFPSAHGQKYSRPPEKGQTLLSEMFSATKDKSSDEAQAEIRPHSENLTGDICSDSEEGRSDQAQALLLSEELVIPPIPNAFPPQDTLHTLDSNEPPLCDTPQINENSDPKRNAID